MERKIKCQRDPAEPPILQSPGGLNKMMRAIVNNAHIKEKYNTTVILEDPWILQFDNFATRDHWDWLENELRDKVSPLQLHDTPGTNTPGVDTPVGAPICFC